VGIVWAAAWWLLYRDPAAMSGVNRAELRLIEEGGGIPELSRKLEESPSTSVWRELGFVLGKRKLWVLYIG
jgi:ACS family D-galactonate transporter-like MFS transporter